MYVQAAASLREDIPAMAVEDVLDGVEAAATALCDDAFEHEEVSIAGRRFVHEYVGPSALN
jgi:hypothetical protein